RMEPGALRIALAPIYATLRRLDPVWRQERLAALQFAQAQDVLSEPEFAQLSRRLGEPTKEALIPPPAKPKTSSVGRSEAHLGKARTMRGLGFDRAQVANHLQSIGLDASDAEHIVQVAFRGAA